MSSHLAQPLNPLKRLYLVTVSSDHLVWSSSAAEAEDFVLSLPLDQVDPKDWYGTTKLSRHEPAAGTTYDGSTKADIKLGTLSGFAGSETVRATAIGNFDSRDAGVRSATATYTLADGTGLASNYQLADTTGLIAIIEKAPVEYLNGGGDNNYAASWVRFQNEKTSPVLWPQMTNGAVPAVEIRSPGVRLPDSALVIDLPALAAVNTP